MCNHYTVFYSKALSEDDLKLAFRNDKIRVSWTNSKNEKILKEYTIADLIEFTYEIKE